MRKIISVVLLVLTILISLSFSGFDSSLEGMTEDRVIDSDMEEEGLSPAMAPAVAPLLNHCRRISSGGYARRIFSHGQRVPCDKGAFSRSTTFSGRVSAYIQHDAEGRNFSDSTALIFF